MNIFRKKNPKLTQELNLEDFFKSNYDIDLKDLSNFYKEITKLRNIDKIYHELESNPDFYKAHKEYCKIIGLTDDISGINDYDIPDMSSENGDPIIEIYLTAVYIALQRANPMYDLFKRDQ